MEGINLKNKLYTLFVLSLLICANVLFAQQTPDEKQTLADAQTLVRLNDLPGACLVLNEGLKKHPASVALLQCRASVYVLNNEPQKAFADIETALGIVPSDSTINLQYIQLGMKLKLYKKVVVQSGKMLNVFPAKLYLMLTRAEANMQLKNYSEALTDIEHFLQLFPENCDAIFLQATVNNLDHKSGEAIKVFDKLIAKNSGRPEYFAARADAQMMLQNFSQAADDYGMALDLDASNSELNLKKAKALIAQNKKEEACVYLERACRNGNSEACSLVRKNCKK